MTLQFSQSDLLILAPDQLRFNSILCFGAHAAVPEDIYMKNYVIIEVEYDLYTKLKFLPNANLVEIVIAKIQSMWCDI